ncbi:DUF551 domain-containing protein [Cronobacter turicensis]|nr:DUF551 domain-containing protein [Cronobacter turicensis]ELY4383731.1 DUF551 domain-containing protein [Cronobacter turicensis]
MSTISTEQAKDLRNAFECWQQDYDPVEDKEQYDMFGLGVVAMDELLALRKEREKAEPVVKAAEKLVRCKGRYHSEQNYRALAALFGVTTPDLPQLEGEASPTPVVADDKFQRALFVLNETLDDCGDSERGLLLALSKMDIVVSGESCRAAMLKSGNDEIGSWSNLKNTPTDKPKSEMSQKAEQLVRDTTALAEKLSAETDTTAQQFESLVGKSMSGWIPCSERMPETYVNVLLTDEHGDTCIGQLESCEDAHFYISSSIHRYKATHWQPLPEPPCK